MLAQEEDNSEPPEIPPVSEETPQFKDISIKGITCRGARQAVYLQGLPEMNLENVYMEDLTMEAENGLLCMDADGITIKGLNLITDNQPAVTFYNSKNVSIEGLVLPESDQTMIAVKGAETENIIIDADLASGADHVLTLGEKVSPGTVTVQ